METISGFSQNNRKVNAVLQDSMLEIQNLAGGQSQNYSFADIARVETLEQKSEKKRSLIFIVLVGWFVGMFCMMLLIFGFIILYNTRLKLLIPVLIIGIFSIVRSLISGLKSQKVNVSLIQIYLKSNIVITLESSKNNCEQFSNRIQSRLNNLI